LFPTGLGKPCQARNSRRGRVSHSFNRHGDYFFIFSNSFNGEFKRSALLKLKSIKNSALLNFN
jgi:hypothetical protein